MVGAEKGVVCEAANACFVQLDEIAVLGSHSASRIAWSTTIAMQTRTRQGAIVVSGYPGPMSDHRTFGRAVREARLAKGMSMGQLAAAVERSTASVRRWERDQGVPTETVVQELIVVLNLDEGDALALAAAPPPVVAAVPQSAEPSDATRATSASPTNSVLTTTQPVSETGSWISSLRDPDKPWLGYLRATLTVIVLLVLAWVLVWALSGFLVAFGDVWESLWVDAP